MVMVFTIPYGPLVKRLNTPPSQGGIHGFETRTGYQLRIKPLNFKGFNISKYKIYFA